MKTSTQKIKAALTAAVLFAGGWVMNTAHADENDTVSAAQQQNMQQSLVYLNQQASNRMNLQMDTRLFNQMAALKTIENQEVAELQAAHPGREVVVIGMDRSHSRITAQATTPVVVVLDRQEICLTNL